MVMNMEYPSQEFEHYEETQYYIHFEDGGTMIRSSLRAAREQYKRETELDRKCMITKQITKSVTTHFFDHVQGKL